MTIPGDEQQDALFEVEEDWKDTWRGMPSYDHQDLQPWQSIYVHFKTQADRESFAKLVGQQLHSRTKFIWHPKAEIGTAADKVFTGKKVIPRYPIYIISKGRWESRLTSKALEWIGVPYHIVVEPQEYDQYAAVIDPAKILTLPFSTLGLGGIPARNWVWDHAVATAAERHWILDDNISGFCRFQDNLKVELDNGATFCALEDWVDRYENVVIAAFNYDYFAPRKQGVKIRPITLNTRCYSGILLRNDLKNADGTPVRWRGRYNEDTDLSIRLLKDGYCSALFNAFLMYKKSTLTMKGGNTDELYAGVEAMAAEWEAHAAECSTCKQTVDGYDSRVTPCQEGRAILSKDGRWLMAESLREQHPDITTVERKWRRWQHQVDYRRFRDNQLKLREGVVIADVSEYELELAVMPQDESPIVSASPASKAVIIGAAPSAIDFVLQAAQGRPEASSPTIAPAQPEPTVQTSQAEPDRPAKLEVGSLGPEALKRHLEVVEGFTLLTAEGKIFVTPASKLTDELRVAIKQHKQALIDLLIAKTAESQQSIDMFAEERPAQTLVEFLGSGSAPRRVDYVADVPPELTGIDKVVLNFATTGLDWRKGDKPVGVTVSTLDGELTRFLPFAFLDGNLDESAVKRWAQTELKGKKIYGSNIRFDNHQAREWGVDLEAQGCSFTDVQHTAALLDDHRRRFAIDILAADYLPDLPQMTRVDERRHDQHYASEVAERERFTAQLVGKLRAVMDPQIKEQDLEEIQQLEDDVIPAVVEMEKNGSPIAVPLLEQFSKECMAEHGRLLIEISGQVGFAFEHTPKGWQRLLEYLSLPVPESFDEDELALIDHPLIRLGQRASQHASLNSKVFEPYKRNIINNVLYYDINQLRGDKGGTVSGRFSIEYVQQVPNRDNHEAAFGDKWNPRRLYISGEGNYLEADAAQIEFRLFAHYAANPQLLAAYAKDPHMSFHKTMWAMLQAYKSDMLYTHTKSFNFARQYGARSIKLAVMMKFITEKEGAQIRRDKMWNDPRLDLIHQIESAYNRALPEGGDLLDRAAHLAKPKCDEYCKRDDKFHRQLQHRGYVKTLRGRRSRFLYNSKTYIGLNRVLQGTGADIMKLKIAALHRERKHTGFVMRITNHDATLGDATTPETRERVSSILNQQSYSELKVPILWECGVGRNWAECK